MIATDVAALPLELKRRRNGGKTAVTADPRYDLLFCEPNADTTPIRFFQAFIGHRLGWGNAYAEIERYRSGSLAGLPAALHLLSPKPSDTWPIKSRKGRLYYKIDGGRRELLAEDVIHHAGLGWDGLTGYSPVALARQAIGLGIATEQFGAAFYGNSSVPKGALKVPRKLSTDAYRNLRESVEAVHQGTSSAHRMMILEEGIEWQNITISPEDAQFLDSRKFQVIEVCRIYRVPPHKIGDWSQTGSAYRAVEEANIDYRNTTLNPESVSLRQEISRKLLTKRERAHGLCLEHDFKSLMQGDSAARTAYYRERFATGSMSPDQIAEAEGDNPLPGGIGKHFYIPSELRRIDIEPEAEEEAETDQETESESGSSPTDPGATSPEAATEIDAEGGDE